MAVRGDLADVRLADRVFAPHYAAPLARVLRSDASLRAERGGVAAVLANLRSGDAFELLDVTGDSGWGIASRQNLVGYVDVAVLGPAT